ncbi:MAG: hypothetical protein ACK4N5_06835, partial [Myxococcales bacterium]
PMAARALRQIERDRLHRVGLRAWAVCAALCALVGVVVAVRSDCTPSKAEALGFGAFVLAFSFLVASRLLLLASVSPRSSLLLLGFAIPLVSPAPLTLLLLVLLGPGYLREIEARLCAVQAVVAGLWVSGALWGAGMAALRRKLQRGRRS